MRNTRAGMSEREYAAHAGISRGAVQKARASGRLVLLADGSIDAAASDARRAQTTDPGKQPVGREALKPVPEAASEMLPLTKNEQLSGGTVIRQGIEFDGIGRRIAYHFLRRQSAGDITDPGLAPGSSPGASTVRIPASEVIHVIDPVDAGQLRGVSKFASAIVKLFLLDQYDDAELDRKKVAAMHALFITTPAPAEPFDATETTGTDGERTLDLQPGQIVMLEPGEQVQTSDPADSARPTSRSSTGRSCRSRPPWAFRMRTCPTI